MADADVFLASAVIRFRAQKRLAERAINQISDEDLHQSLTAETNCIAVIMQHLAGNMRSRWTEFLTTDGEKTWRDRDQEFMDKRVSRAEVLQDWESGWDCLFGALESLTAADLAQEVTIRGELHNIYEAILRQLDHYGYHVGQIVLIARVRAGEQKWKTLSIARGASDEFNEANWGKVIRNRNGDG